jgi:hypothetical protein
MYGVEKSDSLGVPRKPTNKTGRQTRLQHCSAGSWRDGGGKQRERGECGTAKRASDTEPGSVLRLKAIREVGWTLRVPGSGEDKRLPLRSTVSQLAM